MKMPLSIFPPHIIKHYDLHNKARNGLVYLNIRKSIYSPPQSGALANVYLKNKLPPAVYYKVLRTPGLWKHISCPIQLILVVDDFGVKCVRKQHIYHLCTSPKNNFTISEDLKGGLYCGI